MHVFVYGTLMDDALVAQLTGRTFHKEPAVLVGYRKIALAGGYPYIVGDPDAQVSGFLLHDVDAQALQILDQYEEEGRLYQRTEVIVMVGRRRETCMTYVGVAAALAKAFRER